jgi:uncharacterized protein YjbI with pentapeptide repeats
MLLISDFPLPLYGLIRDYLIDYKDSSYSKKIQLRSWRSLLNSSNKEIFREIKKNFNYYCFSKKTSELYFRRLIGQGHAKFQDYSQLCTLLDSKIVNSNTQICLFTDFLIIPTCEIPVHAVMVDPYCNFTTLINHFDPSVLKQVKYIRLADCIFKCDDVSIFSNCEFLNLSSTDEISNENVFHVSNVRILDLSCGELLSNLNSLRNVYDLNVSSNDTIKDVSMLGKVYKLNISYCNGVTDISAVSTVRILDISFMSNLEIGLNATHSIKSITVSENGFPFINNVTQSAFCPQIIFSDCFNESYAKLILNWNADTLTNISFEGNLNIPDPLEHFPKVEKLRLQSSKLERPIIALSSLICLEVVNCNQGGFLSIDFTSLINLESVYFENSCLSELFLRNSKIKDVTIVKCNIHHCSMYLFNMLNRLRVFVSDRLNVFLLEDGNITNVDCDFPSSLNIIKK